MRRTINYGGAQAITGLNLNKNLAMKYGFKPSEGNFTLGLWEKGVFTKEYAYYRNLNNTYTSDYNVFLRNSSEPQAVCVGN